MRIEWTPALSTNFPEVDEQHKELIRRINAMFDACAANKPREEVARLIDFLEEYTVTHFTSEENRMLDLDYPEYRQHKAEHAVFITWVADMKRKFHDEGAGADVLSLITQNLMEWLNGHIRKTDWKLGKYLRDYGTGTSDGKEGKRQ
jgi:hemerythrin